MLSATGRPRCCGERGQLKTLLTEPEAPSASTAIGSESSPITTDLSRTSKQPSRIGLAATLSMTGILDPPVLAIPANSWRTGRRESGRPHGGTTIRYLTAATVQLAGARGGRDGPGICTADDPLIPGGTRQAHPHAAGRGLRHPLGCDPREISTPVLFVHGAQDRLVPARTPRGWRSAASASESHGADAAVC